MGKAGAELTHGLFQLFHDGNGGVIVEIIVLEDKSMEEDMDQMIAERLCNGGNLGFWG